MWPTKSIHNLFFPELLLVQMHRDPVTVGLSQRFTIHVDEEQLSPASIRKAGRSQDGGIPTSDSTALAERRCEKNQHA